MTRPSSCVSVDMDALGCYAAIHGLDAGPADAPDPIWDVAMGRFLDLFDTTDIRATFFCVGADLDRPNVAGHMRRALAAGHEIASHSQNHLYNLRDQPPETIEREIIDCEDAIEHATGHRPVGFRTPGYNLSPTIAEILARRGYRYDSSLFPCPPYYAAKGLIMARMRLAGRPSRSRMTLPQTLLAPLRPYRADPSNPWRRARGEGHLWEVPMALLPGLRFPLIGTSLHLIGARGFERLMPIIARTHPKLFNLEFHGIDMLDRGDQGVSVALAEKQPDLSVSATEKGRLWRSIFDALGDRYAHRTLEEAVGGLRY